MFNDHDAIQLKEKGLTRDLLEWQLDVFRNGVQYINLKRAAIFDDGIVRLSEEELKKYSDEYDSDSNIKKIKFVPASGAATRMFKSLYEYIDGAGTANKEVNEFFIKLDQFAFFSELKKVISITGTSIDKLIEEKRYKDIIGFLLNQNGLNYGQLPKGILSFHRYNDVARTPFEEHLMEGALYAVSGSDQVNIHFTVSPEHKEAFNKLLSEKEQFFANKYGVSYNIGFSTQKPSTDTIAVDSSDKPFRNADQSILFRPGGHGALLQNLNELDSDLVFIKNIDNVVPERLIDTTILYKKALAGLLLNIRRKVFSILNEIDTKNVVSSDRINEILQFLRNVLCYEPYSMPDLTDPGQAILYFRKILDRPIRVCGVVKNIGEPGGGPFWAPNSMGDISLQIVEGSQVNTNNIEQTKLFKTATHFNPVDLVCSTRNYKEKKFDLTKFVDNSTCFISRKSKDGKELKALELPGLWNGSMADWLTIFVEVPIETFNPVKIINDLLRKEHLK